MSDRRRASSPAPTDATPIVSIVVPVFNRERLLAQCLRSIQQQTLAAWECLVVDDGSSDRSLEVARAFAEEDGRFKAIARSTPVKGAGASRNEGLRLSQGRYVMFLDSDDLLSETCLARRVEAFEHYPDEDLLIFPTAAYFQDLDDRRLLHNIDKPSSDLLRFLRLDNPWPINGPLWKRSELLDVGGFDESLPSWQDWQLHVVALLMGKRHRKMPSAPDSFIRIEGADRIGEGAWAIGRVRPNAELVIRLAERFRDALVAEAQLRAAVAGLTWHLVVRLQELGEVKRALGHWSRLRALGYVGAGLWFEGVLALLLHGHPGGGLCWSRVAQWPKAIVGNVDTSTTMSVSY